MLADKYLSRDVWEAKLRRYGCKPYDGDPRLATAEWWIAPGGLFTVPVEQDGRCEFWAIQKLIDQFCWGPEGTPH